MSPEVHDVAVDDEQAVMLAWIETHWARLAAVAWCGYVLAGRGLVVLDGDWDGAVAVGYLSAASAAASGVVWPATVRAAVQTYPPATALLCFILQDAAGTLLEVQATPPRLPPRLAGQRDGTPLVLAA
jgi:hypothetical protein